MGVDARRGTVTGHWATWGGLIAGIARSVTSDSPAIVAEPWTGTITWTCFQAG